MTISNKSKKGILSNDELSSFLSELDIIPYKNDFQRWWRILYCSHHATDGLGMPAFLRWCKGDKDLLSVIDEAQENWEDVKKVNPIYDVDYLARELASQGKMRLQERLSESHPVKLTRKLKQLVNDIRVREDVNHCIAAMVEINNLPFAERYETFLKIKEKTDVTLRVLESMFDEALIAYNQGSTSWPDVKTAKGKLKLMPTTRNFNYFCNLRNISVITNAMRQKVEILLDGEPIDEIHLRDLMNEMGMSGYANTLKPIIKMLGKKNGEYHPVKEWLEGKAWDGVDRIELLAAKLNVLRCPPDLLRIYLTRWLLCGIEAIYNERGVGKQSMLVLQGRPGCGKTAFFESLIPENVRYKWFTSGLRQPWNAQENGKSKQTWLTEIARIDELLIYGHVIMGRKRTLLDMSAHLDTDHEVVFHKEIIRRTFYGAGISTYDERIAYAADRHYFVLPIGDINFNAEIDPQQLWLQIKSLYDDGQRHVLLKSEHDKHMHYAAVVSTRPRWTTEGRGYAGAAKQG